MDNIILLGVIVGLVLTCTLVIIWQIKSLFVTQKEFLYEKIEQIDRRVFENSKETASQIEKNAELFIKISNSQQLMRNEQQKSLYEMSKEIKGKVVRTWKNSLKK